jgi:hypothetical protein
VRSSRRRVFVGSGGGSLSLDMRRSNARTRSVTPGECGPPPSAGTTLSRGGVSVSGAGDGGGAGSGAGSGGSSYELSVRVELYEDSPRTYRARNGLLPKEDDADALRPEGPAETPNSSSAKGFVSCESSVASRWTMSIDPPTRSRDSVLAVCSEDADLPCDISR